MRVGKAAIQAHIAVRRMAMSVVALHVVANVVDYYITKYSAKPMEQLQNLITQYALGLRRLEVESEQQGFHVSNPGAIQPHADPHASIKARSRKILLNLQHSANRSKWISSTECALYVHTEQQHFTSHNEVPMFLSRPIFQISECKRILSGSKHLLSRAAAHVNFSVWDFATAADAELVPTCGVPQPAKAATAFHI